MVHNNRRSDAPNRGNSSDKNNPKKLSPIVRKTNAIASEKSHFFTRRHVIDRDEGISSTIQTKKGKKPDIKPMISGNIANKLINPNVFNGPKIATNSPSVYPDGEIVKIIPLGGTNEVGMNMTVLECGDDIVIIDTGMGFGGGDKYPGVDYLVPDTEYLEMNRHKIRGLIYTHGHLDHIGAAPYILPKIGPIPIFGMPLTLAFLKTRLEEFEIPDKLFAKVIKPGVAITLGKFKINFFRLNHSIPDVVGLEIDTPMGKIVYATDWKFDNSPYDGQFSDYGRLAAMGDEGVRLLITDSLGIMKPGYQISERVVGHELVNIVSKCEGRVLITSFSSSVYIMQFAVDACVKNDRKLALTGRSMIKNFKNAFDLGYIRVPEGVLIDFFDADKLPPEKIMILSTGSQGEDMAALSRMARDEHDKVKLQGGDSVIFSANPIPGNEDAVADLKARLSRKGVAVYNNKEFNTYVSGHACHEDIKLLIALTRPDYLQPIHGDHFMLTRVGELGASVGIPFDHNLIGENGRITELRPTQVVLTEKFITDKCLLVEGTSVGAVSETVLVERRQMSNDGALIVVLLLNKKKQLISGPEIISRGFVYMKSSSELFDQIKEKVKDEYNKLGLDPKSASFFSELRKEIRKIVSKVIYKITEKDPMIIPVVVQV
jgi:ribonuclease J